jgi:hypothetical protein
LNRSYGVLLGASQGGKCWSGWIVAQEGDYATDRDLVLQEEDGPLSPDAVLVQAWNPVRLWLQGDEEILGKLARHRLAAVRELAEDGVNKDAFVAPRPGRIGAWNLADGSTVVTGTPLLDTSDPRKKYQQLYGDLAAEISLASVTQPQLRTRPTKLEVFGWLQQLFVRPAWTFGAMALVLAQGLWIMFSFSLPQEEPAIYRGASPSHKADACTPRIHIIFRPNAPFAEVVVLLHQLEATLVDGPSETGEVWFTVPNDQKIQDAAGVLKLNPLVESADLVPIEKRSCSK